MKPSKWKKCIGDIEVKPFDSKELDDLAKKDGHTIVRKRLVFPFPSKFVHPRSQLPSNL